MDNSIVENIGAKESDVGLLRKLIISQVDKDGDFSGEDAIINMLNNTLKEKRANIESYKSSFEKLSKEYAGQWIVYHQEKVLFHCDNAVDAICFAEEEMFHKAYIVCVGDKPSEVMSVQHDTIGNVDEKDLDKELNLQEYRNNEKEFNRHKAKISKSYAGKWIIFEKGNVVFVSDDFKKASQYALENHFLDAYITKV